jgi:hypothetical protein
MGAQAFEAGYAAGRALSSEEAIELALRGNSPVGSQASDALVANSAGPWPNQFQDPQAILSVG